MEIAPNSTIILLSGVPLDNTYTDTFYFATKALQESHFLSAGQYTRHTFQQQTYQRVKKGVARVDSPADDIYNCNYMLFQNTAYGNKWFYAFITDLEYVNDNTTDVFFELDVMQTYLFDYELEQCYVERETPVRDDFGANIQAEPVQTGDIICHSMDRPSASLALQAMSIVIARADTTTGS